MAEPDGPAAEFAAAEETQCLSQKENNHALTDLMSRLAYVNTNKFVRRREFACDRLSLYNDGCIPGRGSMCGGRPCSCIKGGGPCRCGGKPCNCICGGPCKCGGMKPGEMKQDNSHIQSWNGQ